MGSRGRKPAPFDPLAPSFFRQGGRKASPSGERACRGAERLAHAGAVTALPARAPAKPAPALSWAPWAGSIIPAWRAEVESVGFCGVVAALLSLSAQGRAELVLRVEDKGEVVLVLGSQRTRGIKDAASAQRWAEGIVAVQMGDLNARSAGKLASGAAEGDNAPVGQSAASLEVCDVAPDGAGVVVAAAGSRSRAKGRRPAAPAAGRGGRGPVTLSLNGNKVPHSGNRVDFVDSAEGLCEGLGHGHGSSQGGPSAGLQDQLGPQAAKPDQGRAGRGNQSFSAASTGGRSSEVEAQGRGLSPVACGRASAQGGQDLEARAADGRADQRGRSQPAVSVRVRSQGQELCVKGGRIGGAKVNGNGRLKGVAAEDSFSVDHLIPTIYDTQRNASYPTETGIFSSYGTEFGPARPSGQGVGKDGTNGVAGGRNVGSRGRKPAPFDPLAPSFFRQGGRKASPSGERACRGAERLAHAGAVTALPARAPAKPAPALSWAPWAGSIIPAWRAEVESVGFCGVVAALLSLSAQGRAELVLRVEDKGEVVLVLGSQRTRGIKDAASAQRWAEGIVAVQMGDLNARSAGKLASGAAEGDNAPVGQSAASLEVCDVAPDGAGVVVAAAGSRSRAKGRRPAAPAAGRGGRGPVTLSLNGNKVPHSGNRVDFVDSAEGLCEGLGHGHGSSQGGPSAGLQDQLGPQAAKPDQGRAGRGNQSFSAASTGGRSSEVEAQGRGLSPVACGRASAQGGQDLEARAADGRADQRGRSQPAVSVRVRSQGQELCVKGGRIGGAKVNGNGRLKGVAAEDSFSVDHLIPTIYDTHCMHLSATL